MLKVKKNPFSHAIELLFSLIQMVERDETLH